MNLNLGCGGQLPEGYVNVDLVSNGCTIVADGRRLPFRDDAFAHTVIQHVLSLMDYPDIAVVLKEARRVTAGYVRVSDMDPERAWRAFTVGNQDFFDGVGAPIVGIVRQYEWLLNLHGARRSRLVLDAVGDMARVAGFDHVERCEYLASHDDNLAALDQRPGESWFVELS